MRSLVIGLSGANGLDVSLSKFLGIKLLHVESRLFPDGESYIRFTNVEDVMGSDIVLIQSLYPNQDKKYLELLLAVDTVRDLGCRTVTVIVPYMAYSRQDRAFLPGEAISIRTLLKVISSLGVDNLITIDIHKEESLKYFKGIAVNLDPTPLFTDVLRNLTKNPVIIAPDQGAMNKALKLNHMIGYGDYVVFRKSRDRFTGEIRHDLTEVEVTDREVIIVDDIISTGTTIANIARYLYNKRPSKIYVVCSHGLFVNNAIDKLISSGVSEIFALNTVPLPSSVRVIDSTPLIADALRKLAK